RKAGRLDATLPIDLQVCVAEAMEAFEAAAGGQDRRVVFLPGAGWAPPSPAPQGFAPGFQGPCPRRPPGGGVLGGGSQPARRGGRSGFTARRLRDGWPQWQAAGARPRPEEGCPEPSREDPPTEMLSGSRAAARARGRWRSWLG